jgi:hypothetical protein
MYAVCTCLCSCKPSLLLALKISFDGWCVGKDLEGSTANPIEILFQNISDENKRNHEKAVRVTVVTAEIRTEHLPN